MFEEISRRVFFRRTAGLFLLAMGGNEKSPPKPDWAHELTGLLEDYPEIDKRIKGCEWVRTVLQRNIVLIGKLTTKNEREKELTLLASRDSVRGIEHLDNAYLVNSEAVKCALWMKRNLGEITADPNCGFNCLRYFSLLIYNSFIDFHQIGTDACSHGNSGRHYGILSPELVKVYPEREKAVIDSIEKTSDGIFAEVHDSVKNPNCIMANLYEYEGRIENLAKIMLKGGYLTLSQVQAVGEALHGRIDEDKYFLFGKKKDELEKMLKELKKRLELPENWK